MKIRDDGQTHMSAINLEGCTETELLHVSAHPAVHADVRRMAAIYIESRKNRLAGNIGVALRLEAAADRLYDTLPKWARW
jgi:hypothetical protein